MRNGRFVRKLAGFLAALTLLQCGAPLTALAAEQESDQIVAEVQQNTQVQLQDGTAIIPEGASEAEVKQALFDALVSNKDELGEDFNPLSLNWEYEREGWTKKFGITVWGNRMFGPLSEFTKEYKETFKYTYTYPSLVEAADDTYKVRLAGDNGNGVTLTKVAKGTSSITLNEGCSVALPYNEDNTVDYDALRQSIFTTVVASTNPKLTVDDVTIEYYYKGITRVDSKWLPLEGQDIVGGMGYPAISTGEKQIRVSYAGNDKYYGSSAETTVTITERPEADIQINENASVKLTVTEDMQLDIEKLYQDVFSEVIVSSIPELTLDDVTIEYYAENVVLGKPGGTYAWMPLEGGKSDIREFPAISAGDQKIRIFFAGNQQYAPTTIEATITVKDREKVQFNLKDAPYEVGMVFTADQGYNYDATAAAIYNAVVASTTNPTGLTAEDVTVEYNVDKTGITDTFKPLNETDLTGLVKFGTGTWEIRISWAGNQEFKGNSVTVEVTTTDSRAASTVALKEGVSFTYNMDVNAMKQAIFDNAIDWENSTLPAKENLSIDNFTIEYKAKLTDAETGLNVDLGGLLEKFPGLGNIINNDTLTQWVPIEGKVYSIGGTVLGQFPQMGAGENQQIRVNYNGDAEYRPSDFTQGTVTVNKAKVSVKVNSTNIYADEALPENFITLDPNDKFDLYTIYAGVTSNVTTGIYLDLPERYTDNSLIIQAIDKVLEGLGQKTLTQMMNDGVTVGELRALFNTQGVLDALEALGINTGTFGQILTVINKLPGLLDSVRISFGTPNRAGLYTVAVVTDSKNYETGVGIGFLLVKMRLSGANLTWNQEISGGKLTAEQAKTFNFGATLSYNGDVTVDQSGVHYLYSGFTSKWKIYSSTTTPPTEPGRYVVTVCILGGNYMAAPITRSFQITK